MTADELLLNIHKACCELEEDGQPPQEIIINSKYKDMLLSTAKYVTIPQTDNCKWLLFGLEVQFLPLMDDYTFIVNCLRKVKE